MKRSDERDGTPLPSGEGASSVAVPSYSAVDIQVLDGLEAVRKRPAMYVGNVRDGSALQHMALEIIGNSIDQHLSGRARHLRVDVEGDWMIIEDDGPGIPVDVCPMWGRSAMEVIFTTLHAGATFDGHHPHVHVTHQVHGVGVACVNALSARFEAESRREGKVWRIAFERGRVVEPLASHGPASRSGTRIRYRPDPEIFPCGTRTNAEALELRLRELAYLNPLLKIDCCGQELPGRGGPAAWVRALAGEVGGRVVLGAHETIEGAVVDLALAWRASGSEAPLIHSFVSQSHTRDGGTHVRGFWGGLIEALSPLVQGATDRSVRELFGPGLVAVLNVGLDAPQFFSPTRDRLDSPIAAMAAHRVVASAVGTVFAPRHRRGSEGLAAFLRARVPPPS
jgi:DNA gyrase subunit B